MVISNNSSLKVALAQLTSVDSFAINMKSIEKCIVEADGASIIFFPENCLYLRVIEGEKISGLILNDSIFSELSALALKYQIKIHLGSVPLKIENDLYNSSVWVFDDGRIIPSYQKIHLFDIQLQGRPAIRESDIFKRGKAGLISQVLDWRIGESICYDLRFAELFNFYGKNEVDIITVPAAFLVPTGKAHWHSLLRARAIENQCYVIASAQAGTHRSVKDQKTIRETFGHSLLISPWGEELVDLGEETEAVRIFEIQKKEIEKVRKQIPMKDHRII